MNNCNRKKMQQENLNRKLTLICVGLKCDNPIKIKANNQQQNKTVRSVKHLIQLETLKKNYFL